MYVNNDLQNRKLKILLVSAEVAPFAKTGGLADVAGSLPKALAIQGNDVRIVLPKYQFVETLPPVQDFPVQMGERKTTCIVRSTSLEAQFGDKNCRVPVYFLDNYHYFDRDGLYMYADDAERFIFFCKAVLEMLPRIGFQPDIIHCNDWHTGPICVMLKELYQSQEFYGQIATLFTIHNLRYQGIFGKEVLPLMGLTEQCFTPDKLEFWGQVNFIKAGLVYADLINTVSKTYAQEIQTPAYGEGLDGLLRSRAADLYGIVNGIDYHEFNPQTDPRIFRHYDHQHYLAKKENKAALQQEMNLPVKDTPVLGMVTRLVDQKGLDLLEQSASQLMRQDLQLIVLGEGDPRYEAFFTQLQAQYPEKVAAFIGFNAHLAQRIYAGSDIFLMPSKFEPCGLGQLISMRYGTIPVVRATGGLADTVLDFNSQTHAGNGFVFQEYQAEAFAKTVARAVNFYRQQPELWQRLVRFDLQLDYSWNKAAIEYRQLYEQTLVKHQKKNQVA